MEAEAAMQAQNEQMMALVMDQYNHMSVSMEEEKKAKLEQIYDQIVSVQDGIGSAKTTLETTAREAETEARVSAASRGRVLIGGVGFSRSGSVLITSHISPPIRRLKTFMQGNVSATARQEMWFK